MYIAPGQGAYSPRGQSFDVNRNLLSLRSSVASFKSQTTIVSKKSIVLPFSYTKALGTKFDLVGHGQPRVISWTNLVVLKHPMLHTKFQGHLPFGSGEADFLRFLPYMDIAAILFMWPRPFEQSFVPLSHGGSIWNLTDWPSGFREDV